MSETLIHSTRAVPAGGTGRYLTLTLKGERYAVDITDVTEIIRFRPLTTVPMTPPYIRGVTNLRGRVLPVLDLAARLGHGETEPGLHSAIIVVRHREQTRENRSVGIIVDAVNKVLELDPEAIQPPPPSGGYHGDTDLVEGLANSEDTFILILKASGVLALNDPPGEGPSTWMATADQLGADG